MLRRLPGGFLKSLLQILAAMARFPENRLRMFHLEGSSYFHVVRPHDLLFTKVPATVIGRMKHFGSSGSQVATVQYKCSKEVHFGSSGSKVATFQYNCSSGSEVATFHYKCSKGSTRSLKRSFKRSFVRSFIRSFRRS